jgi:hypothetical protein
MESDPSTVKWAEAPAFIIVLLQTAEVACTTTYARTPYVLEQARQAVPQHRESRSWPVLIPFGMFYIGR